MSAWHILIAAGIIHCALSFFNVIFVTCAHYPYLCFLKNTGLEIGFLRLKWCTSAFNRRLGKWGLSRSPFWPIWFDIGIVIYLIILPVSTIIILKMTLNLFSAQSGTADKDSDYSLEPMIPGVNLPFEQLGYYIITLLLCLVVHEMGHAMAAVKEEINLIEIGVSVIVIVPVAFVNMCTERLYLLSERKQLRILCAGVWHNVMLAFVAFLMLNLGTWLLTPFYARDSGIIIQSLKSTSPLLGPTGLKELDVIYEINDCSVKNSDDWYDCILLSLRNRNPGYCVRTGLIQDYKVNKQNWSITDFAHEVHCCTTDQENSGHLCFQYKEEDQDLSSYHSCLLARPILERKTKSCASNQDCEPKRSICLAPSLDNAVKVVKIKRKEGKEVLFVGQPADIYYTTSISDWIPKFLLLKSEWPESLMLLCKYVIVFSSGLVIVNAMPCFAFDGQYITVIIMHHLLRSKISDKRKIERLAFYITTVFTALLVINLTFTIVHKLF